MSASAGPVAGVIGWPIGHSLSPRLHRSWLRDLDLDGSYGAHAIAPEALGAGLEALRALGFVGVNVTVPHKQAVMPSCKSLTETAKAIGAVNTLTIDQSGAFHGDNTDAYGCYTHLKASILAAGRPWDPQDIEVAVIGAGGAARAVLYACLEAGHKRITLTNRSPERAEELQTYFTDRMSRLGWDGALVTCPWSERNLAMGKAGLIINATSLGMSGQQPLDISLAACGPETVVYDLVYAPLETPLLAQARAQGLLAVDGLGMLVHQARPAFERFFGQPAPDPRPIYDQLAAQFRAP